MSTKRAKLTADKARERITSLEESIVNREARLEQLNARIARSENPEEKLLKARERLERRIQLETEQVQKLKRLLGRRVNASVRDSSEMFNSEEIDDLHRSFEEVRQDINHMKVRLENADLPRDLPNRLNSFEERISRREEVDSDQFTQLMSLQTTLEQERQTIRRLTRHAREHDSSIDALREAVEDSVVATVDLAERLEELEEHLNGDHHTETSIETEPESHLNEQISVIQERLDELALRLQKLEIPAIQPASGSAENSGDLELILEALDEFDSRLEALEDQSSGVAQETVEVMLPALQAQLNADAAAASAHREEAWTEARFAPVSSGNGRRQAVFSNGNFGFKT